MLIPNAHAGYISWDRYENNLRRLAECAQSRGEERRASPPREGPALLQGLAICGRCGKRMTVRYHYRGQANSFPSTSANAPASRTPARSAPRIAGEGIDKRIGELLLAPSRHWRWKWPWPCKPNSKDVPPKPMPCGTRPSSGPVTPPKPPDVATWPWTPTTAWSPPTWRPTGTNHSAPLAPPKTSTSARRPGPRPWPTPTRRGSPRSASDFPALWSDPRTPQRERKRMVRLLIEDVTLRREDKLITARVRFKAGQTTSFEVTVGLPAYDIRRTPAEVVAEVDRLLDHYTEAGVAAELNRSGVVSGTDQPFNAGMVNHIRRNYGLISRRQRLRARGLVSLQEVASQMGVHPSTVKAWRRQGRLVADKLNDKGEHYYEVPEHPPYKDTGRPPKGAKPALPPHCKNLQPRRPSRPRRPR